MPRTDDLRIREMKELTPPSHLIREYAVSEQVENTTADCRTALHRILHGQDKRRRVESTIGRFYVTLEHIVGHNGIIGKKAIGGFEHRAVATGFRQSGPGTLGERMRQCDQTLGPPQVAEFSVGKLRDSPTRGLDEVAHICFLAQRVEPEVEGENPCLS